jgi:hypothetical protein
MCLGLLSDLTGVDFWFFLRKKHIAMGYMGCLSGLVVFLSVI